jgi:hypothetical protein
MLVSRLPRIITAIRIAPATRPMTAYPQPGKPLLPLRTA